MRLVLTLFVALVCTSVALAKPTHSRYYTQAKRIVFSTFPDSTQDKALRVVACETGHTYSPWSYNSSGATGYFQILQGNAGRVLRYAGETLTIPSGRALFNPWTNAKVALFLSHGGTDWREWSCG